ncbi:MAG: divalent-cation tolerance protein CutA [Calditrichaceae bacterium]|nr:divalent-cation tolerance protein CutA [Calditrichaceae bacterium]
MDSYIIVFCTTPSYEISHKIAAECIHKKIAACCNIIPGIKSIYRWEGNVEESEEQLLMIKSTEINFKSIENTINSFHTYDVPEIISIKIGSGNESYLKWINESLR